MSVTDATATRESVPESRYWIVAIVRAAVALAVAVAITFSADHSAVVGFLAFGAFGVATGVTQLLGARLLTPGIERTLFFAIGVIGIVAGAASLLARETGTPVLLFIVSAWAAIVGFLELYVGVRSRRRRAVGRDWIFIGAVTAVLAVVVLLIPSGFEQAFVGPDDVERVLTASVIAVGIFGAYAAIAGVYLAIGALSLKWATQKPAIDVVTD